MRGWIVYVDVFSLFISFVPAGVWNAVCRSVVCGFWRALSWPCAVLPFLAHLLIGKCSDLHASWTCWVALQRTSNLSDTPEAQASLLLAQLMCVVGVEQARAACVLACLQSMGLRSSLWRAVVHRAACHGDVVPFCPGTLIGVGTLGSLGIWGSLSHRVVANHFSLSWQTTLCSQISLFVNLNCKVFYIN